MAVTLGDADDPGLVLVNGAVQSLNATVDADIAVGGLTFTADGLTLGYRGATNDLRIGGTSTVGLPAAARPASPSPRTPGWSSGMGS